MYSMKNIIDSDFGLFAKIAEVDVFVEHENKLGIEIKRELIDKNENTLVFQVSVTNNSNEPINVYAIEIGEFIFPGKAIKILENGWGHSSFSGYREKFVSSKRRRWFLKRDQNPFSFNSEYGYLKGSLISEWYTQIVQEDKNLVIGAVTTADQFSQIYMVQESSGLRVRVTCQVDGLQLKPGESLRSEKVVFVVDSEVGHGLYRLADDIKKYSKTRSVASPPVGLCSAYYYQGNVVSEEYLEAQIRALSMFPKRSGLKYIEIDAGYSVWGDWLEINSSFPNGLLKMADKIKKLGYKPGIWLAPLVADPKSKLYKDHSEWFLRDDEGSVVEGRQSTPVDFLPGLSLKVLDPTHPGAQKYLTKVIKQFVAWGFELIKADFTSGVCFSTNYVHPMTRAQALRLGYQTVRAAAGENVHILSGITQLSPLVGVVDSVRVGVDTINPFVQKMPVIGKEVNNYMFKENMRNSVARLFLNGKVWINDTDCFVGRLGTGLTASQEDEQYKFMRKYKGSVWIGDSLKTMMKSNLEQYINLFNRKKTDI